MLLYGLFKGSVFRSKESGIAYLTHILFCVEVDHGDAFDNELSADPWAES
jgi:hypothetical protein